MSTYTVHKICRLILHDKTFRENVRANPSEAIVPFDLTAIEREALLAGDVGMLHRRGALAFLLLIFSRFEVFGLTLEIYNHRMRALRTNTNEQGGLHATRGN